MNSTKSETKKTAHLNLSEDRLTSLNEYGERNFIIPAEVKGSFKFKKNIVHFILLFIFLILPWININGAPAVLFDIPNRKFAFFGITFWAHDGPIIFFILAILTFGLAFVTSIWGRVWCGWACPQTVFIEAVFRRIEILVEGNYIQRRKLNSEEISLTKIFKRSIKWFLFILASTIIAHSFIAYFVGKDALSVMATHPPTENLGIFIFMLTMTLTIAFDFGWFREQFCIIMCPYGRFQSVLMSKNSLAVLYDSIRGEPRKGLKVQDPLQEKKQGDCVSCNRCIQVCPTGIDIRNGLQMECITCTACIDACNEIMEKVGKPKDLIKYSNLAGKPLRYISPRNIVYLFFIITSFFGLFYFVANKKDFYFEVLRAKDSPYQLIQTELGDYVINHYKIHMRNLSSEEITYTISQDKRFEIISAQTSFTVLAMKDREFHFFIKAPRLLIQNGKLLTQIQFTNNKNELITKEIMLLGP